MKVRDFLTGHPETEYLEIKVVFKTNYIFCNKHHIRTPDDAVLLDDPCVKYEYSVPGTGDFFNIGNYYYGDNGICFHPWLDLIFGTTESVPLIYQVPDELLDLTVNAMYVMYPFEYPIYTGNDTCGYALNVCEQDELSGKTEYEFEKLSCEPSYESLFETIKKKTNPRTYFFVQRMVGEPESKIREIREKAKEVISKEAGLDPSLIIDNNPIDPAQIKSEDWTKRDQMEICADSIRKIIESDYVVFCSDWSYSSECRPVRNFVDEFWIPSVEVKKDGTLTAINNPS